MAVPVLRQGRLDAREGLGQRLDVAHLEGQALGWRGCRQMSCGSDVTRVGAHAEHFTAAAHRRPNIGELLS